MHTAEQLAFLSVLHTEAAEAKGFEQGQRSAALNFLFIEAAKGFSLDELMPPHKPTNKGDLIRNVWKKIRRQQEPQLPHIREVTHTGVAQLDTETRQCTLRLTTAPDLLLQNIGEMTIEIAGIGERLRIDRWFPMIQKIDDDSLIITDQVNENGNTIARRPTRHDMKQYIATVTTFTPHAAVSVAA
ncbi:MAG: hypothetical protein HYV40_06930 [Candidatus Levybacteria bacterium]|nr:hypothetical protein [Candidatus Levybacteria bacterium]